jgi:hypothetical protein
MGFGELLKNEGTFGKTWNGEDTLVSTGDYCLDLFGRGGSLRNTSANEKIKIFSKAYSENADLAMKLLFYIRDIRGGYGERDTFNTIITWLADEHPESVIKNIWAFMEYGRGKDLYSLVGTKAENEMWKFIKYKFEQDWENMKAGKSISLLAKWLATPDASSARTAGLGKLTAKKLGYNFKTMRDYKRKLREMRKYLDVTEVKMCANEWSNIAYSNVASQCLRKSRNAFIKHDNERFNTFLESVKSGETKMNTGTLTPVDVVSEVTKLVGDDFETFFDTSDSMKALETMWSNLEDVNKGNVLVMCDTSGSMYSGWGSVKPITVALAMTLYLAERNKGDLKNLFMTFSSSPNIRHIQGDTLLEKLQSISQSAWGLGTNLELAFSKLLDICTSNNLSSEDMPEAVVVVSDMQINQCTTCEVDGDGKLLFYDRMSKRYANAGYKMPHLVFWNVNASSPSFIVKGGQAGASLVSGYSTNIFKQVIDSIGSSPMELMMKVIGSPRYENIIA